VIFLFGTNRYNLYLRRNNLNQKVYSCSQTINFLCIVLVNSCLLLCAIKKFVLQPLFERFVAHDQMIEKFWYTS